MNAYEILSKDTHYFLSNHNDYFPVPNTGAVAGRVASPLATYASLDLWQPVMKGEKHSLSDDPLFVNAALGDYHLQNRLSPCINAGTLEVYDTVFLPVEMDSSAPRVSSGSSAGGPYAYRALGIDIGADEFRSNSQSQDADLGAAFLRGDADGNAIVQVTDAIYILDYLFQGGSEPLCWDAADANDDETLALSDTVTILNFLFNNSLIHFANLVTLPEPFPQCGFDIYRLGEPGPQPVGGPLYCQVGACP